MKKKGIKILHKTGVAFLVTGGLGVMASFGLLIGYGVKSNEKLRLADQNGYDAANAVYIQSEIGKLSEQLAQQAISPSDYKKAVKNIEDLDKDVYMANANIRPEIKEEYMTLKQDSANLKKGFAYTFSMSVISLVLGLGSMSIESYVSTEGINSKPVELEG